MKKKTKNILHKLCGTYLIIALIAFGIVIGSFFGWEILLFLFFIGLTVFIFCIFINTIEGE